MNSKPTVLLDGCRAMLFLLWLSLGIWKCSGQIADRFPDASHPAEFFIWNHLTNRPAASDQGPIDLAGITSSAVTNRIISGKFLEWILTENIKQLPHEGLRLKNAIVENPVDLSNVEVPPPVSLECCRFEKNINLAGAHFIHDLSFVGCLFEGEFHASGLRVDGLLEFKKFYPANKWEMQSGAAPPGAQDVIRFFVTNQTMKAWAPEHGKFLLDSNRVDRKWIISDSRTNRTSATTNEWTNYFEATTRGHALFLVQLYDDAAAEISTSVMNLTAGPLTNQWQLVTNTGLLDLDSVRANLAAAPGKDLEFIGIDRHATNQALEFIRTNVLTTNAHSSIASINWFFENQDTNNPASMPLAAQWSELVETNQQIVTNDLPPLLQTNLVPVTNQTTVFFQPTIFRGKVQLDGAMIASKLDAGGAEFRDELYCHSLKVGDDLMMNDARFAGAAIFTYAQIGHDFGLQNSAFSKIFDSYGMSVGGSLIIEQARYEDRAEFGDVSVGKAFKARHVHFENPNVLTEFRGMKVEGSADFLRAQFAGPANFILSHFKGNFEAKGATFEDDHSFADLKTLTSDTFTFNTDFGSMTVDGFTIFENTFFVRSVSFQNARFGNLHLDGVRWPANNVLLTYTNDPVTNDLLRLEGVDFATIRDITSLRFLHTREQLKESQKNLLNMFETRSPYSFDVYEKLESYFRREGEPKLANDVFIAAKVRQRGDFPITKHLPHELSTLWAVPVWVGDAFLKLTMGYGRNPWRAVGLSFLGIAIIAFFCRFYMENNPKLVSNGPTNSKPARRQPSFWRCFVFCLDTFLPIGDLKTEDWLVVKKNHPRFKYALILLSLCGYVLIPLWTLALTGLIK